MLMIIFKKIAHYFCELAYMLKNLLIMFWLISWYVINLWLVLGSLTSYQLQQSISGSSTQYTVSSVVRLLNERNRIEYDIDKLMKIIETRKKELDHIYLEAKLDERTYVDIWQQLLMLSSKITHVQRPAVTVIKGTPTQTSYLDCLNVPNQNTNTNVTKNKQIKTYQSLCEQANKYWYEVQNQKTLIPLKKISIEKLQAKHSEQEQALSFLLQSNYQARDYLTQLSYMRKFMFDRLATMPIQLLTLILTLSMGSLGSLIFLTQALFYKKQEMHFVDYLFHPFLGMVMAIAIFILAKSGQLIAVNSSSPKDAINLSPFFISFIAIISGVLSKQAYDKIYHTGKAFFEQGKSQFRWAVDISEIMKKQNKTPKDLQPYIDQKLEVLTEWLSGNKPVPEEYQTIISVWLGTEKRKIFTDIR